ncbi:hypothetical protein R5N98_05975 [Tenacibaculum maritimum]|uniref:hypothetical protein n=1 Tax=Tenacibaculum maritimum TaxID=107401 RepID=UPI003876329B
MPYFIPLGIPDFKGKKDRDFIQVSYLIEGNDAVELTIQIRDGGKIIYQEKITDSSKLTKGEHRWKWNGFDSNGIYDSAVFTTAKDLNIYTIAIDNEENYSRKRVEFTAKYSEVKWVDVKINKNTKRIDVTLRVNLKDGGEIGTEKDCTQVGSGQYSSIKTVCPWEKIPKEVLSYYEKTPIKLRTKSFEELKQLALDGTNTYWSRNQGNIGGNVEIDGEKYETYIKSVISKNGIKAPKITFLTNDEPGRSRNWELSRILFYNVGFLFYNDWKSLNPNNPVFKNKGWYFENNDVEEFKMTSAHEIGHEILLKYGGHKYSKGHKGSSSIITQKSKNIPLPKQGKIDLMKYYDKYYDKQRTVASQKDVLSLLWLTKLELR